MVTFYRLGELKKILYHSIKIARLCMFLDFNHSSSWRQRPEVPVVLKKDIFSSFRSKKPKSTPNNYRRRNVCGACIFTNDSVLLVKQREADKWGFPKGSRECTESKMACMLREVNEETGLVLQECEHTVVGCQTFFESAIYFIYFPVAVSILGPKDVNEISEVAWIPWKDLPTLTLNRVTNHIKRTILLKTEWNEFVSNINK
jgi:8-oxo-dGTP pyrophosphatase MutT (NUDIX family)